MATIAPEAYVDLESAAVEHGALAIDKAGSKAVAKFAAALEEGDIDKANTLISEFDFSGASKTMAKPTGLLLDGLLRFGASQALDGDGSAVSVSSSGDPLIANAKVYLKAALDSATAAAQQAAVQMVADAVTATAQKAETTTDTLAPLKAAARNLSINIAATTSRVASYGFLLQSREVGELVYMLSAVLDSKTSAFCRAIDGKLIPVSVGFDRVVEVLGAQSPDEAKAKAPWPTITPEIVAELEKAGYQELLNMGFVLPPFHPYCRTILVSTGIKSVTRYAETIQQTGLVIGGGTVVSAAMTTLLAMGDEAQVAQQAEMTSLTALGLAPAAAALLVGSDGTSAVLPGYSVEQVAAMVSAIASGASDLTLVLEFGITFVEAAILRAL